MLFVKVEDGNPNGYSMIPMCRVERVVLRDDGDSIIANDGKIYDTLNNGDFFKSVEDIAVPESKKAWTDIMD